MGGRWDGIGEREGAREEREGLGTLTMYRDWK